MKLPLQRPSLWIASALVLLAPAGHAQWVDPVPATLHSEAAQRRILPPGALGGRRVAPGISLAALDPAEIVPTGRMGLPRVGRNRNLPRTTVPGSWSVNGGGQWYWKAAVQARGAHGIRLHFRNFDVGSGQVWIHDGDPANGQAFGPYSGRGAFGDGDFWTEMIFQDTVYLEYLRPDAQPGSPPPFEVTELFHLWLDLAPHDASDVGCFLDEQCYSGNATVASFSNGVGFMVFSDYTCSGTLLNDRNNTNTPYFLSAGHCITSQSDARAMLVVFAYRTSACNGTANSYSSYPQVSGATLLAQSAHLTGSDSLLTDAPDFAFTRLTNFPRATVYSPGWNLSPSASDRLTSISHPVNLPQRLAVGNIIDSSSPFFYTIRMSQGVIDHGSSGSGIVNDSDQVTGVSSYVPNDQSVSGCDINIRDYGYTRFDAIYPLIKQWLEAPPPVVQAAITSPPNGLPLTASSATFTWSNPAGATGYSLLIGSQAGGSNYFNKDFGTSTSGTVTGLPVDGSVLFVRLTTRSAAGTANADYTYVAFRANANGAPIVTGVSSAASASTTISPGSWVSAYGQNLGPATARLWTGSDIVGGVLPTILAGTMVTVDGKAAAVSYAAATQVNFQAPDDGTSGLVPVVVTTAAGSSATMYVTLSPLSVALFQFSQKSSAGAYALAIHADGSSVLPAGLLAGASPASPARSLPYGEQAADRVIPPAPAA